MIIRNIFEYDHKKMIIKKIVMSTRWKGEGSRSTMIMITTRR